MTRTNPAIERGFSFLKGKKCGLEAMQKNVLQLCERCCFFHKLFTPAYVVSAHPLESSTLARLPSGLFFACHKTFSINTVQSSPMARWSRVCVWTLPPLKHSISGLSVSPFF